MAQLTENVTNKIVQLNRARSQKGANQGLIDAEIAKLTTSLPVQRQLLRDFWADQDKQASKWSIGWGDAINNFLDQASDVAG
jgi:lambda family phage tail tape measure protein